MKRCLHCNGLNREDGRFCAHCGKGLAPAPSHPPPSAEANLSPFAKTIVEAPPTEMPRLVVRWPGGQKEEHELAIGTTQVGRAPDNDIVLPFPTLSGHHLQLHVTIKEIRVIDLHSRNGTALNGHRLPANTPHPLSPGDVIRMGDLEGNSLSITIQPSSGVPVHTRPLGIQQLGQHTRMTIGRDPASQVHLNHPSVSRHHAEIERENGHYLIRDLGSANGTFIDGQRIAGSIRLGTGSVIQIGPFKLTYDGQMQGLATAISRGHRLDAINLDMEVGNGHLILNKISLSVQPGEFVALVGGSGAGKSTLLRAMNGVNPATAGQMLINAQSLYANWDAYRTSMAYVPQDDIIHNTLPVGKALWYAAKLRLSDATNQEIDERIKAVLAQVDLSQHINKAVRVLSGGQRKRVSIAVELLADPELLFLDEPASGLDPGLEKKMMYDLNRLADQGKTIVLVTHATSNINQCDHVAFLVQGRLAFFGPPNEAKGFFNTRSFADIYSKLEVEIDPNEGPQEPTLQPYYDHSAHNGKNAKWMLAGLLWADHYQGSPIYQQYVVNKQQKLPKARPAPTPSPNTRGGENKAPSPNTRGGVPSSARSLLPSPSIGGGVGGGGQNNESILRQTWLLARRYFDLIRYDKRTLFILLLMMPLITSLFMAVSGSEDLTGPQLTEAQLEGLIDGQSEEAFEEAKKSEVVAVIDEKLTKRLAGADVRSQESYLPVGTAMVLISMLVIALTQGGTFGAAYEIVKEQAIFKRERAINLRVPAYVSSKVLVLSSFALIQVLSVLLLLNLKISLNVDPVFDFLQHGIIELFITLLLAMLASVMFGLFLSAAVPRSQVVLYVILIQFFAQMTLSGALLPLPSSIPSKAVISHWAIEGVAATINVRELNQKSRICIVAPPQAPSPVVCESTPQDEEKLNLDYDHTEEDLLLVWGVLLGNIVLWYGLTIWIQARKKVA